MLGFRGHFATKSRSYSTTFAALRAERAEFSAARTLAALGLDDTTVTVINDWRYAGPDHPGDAAPPTTSWDAADSAELSGARR